jgi:transposase
MSRMVIDEDMWSRLEKLLPKPKGGPGKDERLFMEAIGWMLRTGAAWQTCRQTTVSGFDCPCAGHHQAR